MPIIEASTLYGNLNLLILKTLDDGPRHGFAIVRRIRSLSGDVLQIEEGALYPALHRLERDGYLRSSWGISEQNRRAKYYEMTASGRRQFEADLAAWVRHTRAVSRVLDVAAL
jgi:transcriptional regulator